METLTLHYLSTTDKALEAAQLLYASLAKSQFFSQPSLLLLSGGSCITVASHLVTLLPSDLDLSQLAVTLADERWVEPGSANSNEQNLRDQGVIQALEQRGATFIPILGRQLSAQESAQAVHTQFQQLLAEKTAVVLLAGMGEDGHTLGILPNSDPSTFFPTFSGEQLVTYYELGEGQDNPHKKRITATFTAVGKVTATYLFAVGENKKSALQHLKNKDETVNNKPVLGLYLSEHPVTVLTDVTL